MKIVQVLTKIPHFLLLFVFLFLILYILRRFYKPKPFYHQSVIFFSRSHKDGAKILIAMLSVSNNYQIIVCYKEEQVATSLKCYDMSLV